MLYTTVVCSRLQVGLRCIVWHYLPYSLQGQQSSLLWSYIRATGYSRAGYLLFI